MFIAEEDLPRVTLVHANKRARFGSGVIPALMVDGTMEDVGMVQRPPSLTAVV